MMKRFTLYASVLIALATPAFAQDSPTEIDTRVVDSGVVDSGVVDSGEVDSGETDSGEVDSGEVDSGEVDSGETDSGETDSGEPDSSAVEDVGAGDVPELDAGDEDEAPAPGEGPDLEPEPEPALTPEHRPTLTVTLDPQDGTMTGDLVTLTITADALTGDDLSVPDEQELAPFEILEADASTQEDGARTTHTFTLTLIALAPGEFELAPITVRILTEDGVIGAIETDIIRIEVGSVLGNEPNAEPRPATEPVELLEDDPTLYWIGGGLLLVLLTALITWLLARYWRRREQEAAPPPPPRPADEIALEKLNGLRKRRDAMLREGEGVEFVDGVSDAIREYLGHRFGFDGLESTTDEVLARLRRRRKKDAPLKAITGLLQDCDLVKFAKAEFTEEQSGLLLTGSFHIVRSTTHALPAAAIPADNPADNAAQSTETRSKPKSSKRSASSKNGEQRWMPPSDDDMKPESSEPEQPVAAPAVVPEQPGATPSIATPSVATSPVAPAQPSHESPPAERSPFARPDIVQTAEVQTARPASPITAEPQSRFARPDTAAAPTHSALSVQGSRGSQATQSPIVAAESSVVPTPKPRVIPHTLQGLEAVSPFVPTPEPRMIPKTQQSPEVPPTPEPAPQGSPHAKPRMIPTTLPSIDPASVPAGTFGKAIPQTLPPFAPVMRPPADTLPDGVRPSAMPVPESPPAESLPAEPPPPSPSRTPSSGSLAGHRGAETLRETPFSAGFEPATEPDAPRDRPSEPQQSDPQEPEGDA